MCHNVTRGEKGGGLIVHVIELEGSLGIFHLIASFRWIAYCIDYR